MVRFQGFGSDSRELRLLIINSDFCPHQETRFFRFSAQRQGLWCANSHSFAFRSPSISFAPASFAANATAGKLGGSRFSRRGGTFLYLPPSPFFGCGRLLSRGQDRRRPGGEEIRLVDERRNCEVKVHLTRTSLRKKSTRGPI